MRLREVSLSVQPTGVCIFLEKGQIIRNIGQIVTSLKNTDSACDAQLLSQVDAPSPMCGGLKWAPAPLSQVANIECDHKPFENQP